MSEHVPDEEPEDMVNHPAHYNMSDARCQRCSTPIECIDVIETMNFNRGSAIKYLWRADNKGNTLEDLKKARWYVEREIDRVKDELTKDEASHE